MSKGPHLHSNFFLLSSTNLKLRKKQPLYSTNTDFNLYYSFIAILVCCGNCEEAIIMRPSKFHNSEVTKGAIRRPQSPLSVNKDTHKIHKSCSPSSSFSSNQQVIENSRATKQPVRRQPQPVIIYTHSPKVIHAKAHDFMALVQKLTGLQRSEDEKTVKSESESTREESSLSEEKDCVKNIGYEDTETSSLSVLSDEKFLGEIKQESCPLSPMFNVSNPYLVDSSFFAPNSNELFYSSRPHSLFQSTSMATSFSSAYMDIMKGLPDY